MCVATKAWAMLLKRRDKNLYSCATTCLMTFGNFNILSTKLGTGGSCFALPLHTHAPHTFLHGMLGLGEGRGRTTPLQNTPKERRGQGRTERLFPWREGHVGCALLSVPLFVSHSSLSLFLCLSLLSFLWLGMCCSLSLLSLPLFFLCLLSASCNMPPLHLILCYASSLSHSLLPLS